MEENRQEVVEMQASEEMMPGVSGDGSGEKRPRKSRKFLWIGILAVVVLVAALSPFAMAMMKKANLRKNPSLYVMDSINETDYNKGRVFESFVRLGDGFKDLIDNQLRYVPVTLNASEVIDFVEGFKVGVSTSDLNYKATGENPVASVRYDIFYKDKGVFDLTFRLGEKGLQFEVVGRKLLLEMDMKPKAYEKQQKLFDDLKKDKEVREIMQRLLSKSELIGTDVVEEKTGEKCDVLKTKISLLDMYEAVKSIVKIMDSNEAVKAFIDGLLDQAIEMSGSGGGYDAQQLGIIKSFLQSGMITYMFQEAIKEYDQEIISMIENYDVYLEGDLYVNQKGVVRSDLNFVIGQIHTMFLDIPSFSIGFNSYLSNMPNEGKISPEGADLALVSVGSGVYYTGGNLNLILDAEQEEILANVYRDIVDKIVTSPGFAEMRKFLEKITDVDELIKSMKSSRF